MCGDNGGIKAKDRFKTFYALHCTHIGTPNILLKLMSQNIEYHLISQSILIKLIQRRFLKIRNSNVNSTMTKITQLKF
jgi:hypothetical protein